MPTPRRQEFHCALGKYCNWRCLLTLRPTKVQQSHFDAVLGRGWTESDLTDAVLTICLFNFMNRLVEAHGIKGSPTFFE